jgi:hypothetical protein
MDLDRLMKISGDYLIPAFIMVGDFLPVAQKGRKGASFFYDTSLYHYLGRKADLLHVDSVSQLKIALDDSSFELSQFEDDFSRLSVTTPQSKIVKKSAEIYEKMRALPILQIYDEVASEFGGVKVFPFPYLTQYSPARSTITMIPRIYVVDRELNINDMLEVNARTATDPNDRSFIFLDGNAHGYAECCYKLFANLPELEKKPTAPAQGIQKFVKKMKVVKGEVIIDTKVAEPEEPVYSFYSEEFFPHSMILPGQCSESIETGKATYKAITSILPKRIANSYFYTNLMMLPHLLFDASGYSQVESAEFFRRPLSSFN